MAASDQGNTVCKNVVFCGNNIHGNAVASSSHSSATTAVAADCITIITSCLFVQTLETLKRNTTLYIHHRSSYYY